MLKLIVNCVNIDGRNRKQEKIWKKKFLELVTTPAFTHAYPRGRCLLLHITNNDFNKFSHLLNLQNC